MSQTYSPAEAVPGHNNPPSGLDDTDLETLLNQAVLRDQYELDHADLLQSVLALLEGVERFFAKVVTINSEEDQARAADFVGQIKLKDKQVDEVRAALALKFRRALEIGQVVFKVGMQDPLKKSASDIEAKMTVYAKKLVAENKRRLDEERREANARAAQAAAQADRTQRPSHVVDAAAAADEAEKADARAASATTASLGRVRGNLGTVASVRTEWTYEVVNINDVPLGFLMIDDAAVRAVIAEGRRDKLNDPGIPGLRIIETSSVKVRV